AGAEGAADGAPDLRADARGAAVAVGDHYRLRVPFAGPREQQLLRAVAALLPCGHLRRRENQSLAQRLPIRLRQVGHLRRVGDEFAVYPVAHLLRAEARPAPRTHQRIDPGGVEAEERNLGVGFWHRLRLYGVRLRTCADIST